MRNRVTEKDLRDYLTGTGYYGRSAKIHDLELVGIGQSGWVQVFRCHLTAKRPDGEWVELWGAIRDDERHRFEARLSESADARNCDLAELTVGLKTPRQTRGETSAVAVAASGVVFILVAALAIVRVFGTG